MVPNRWVVRDQDNTVPSNADPPIADIAIAGRATRTAHSVRAVAGLGRNVVVLIRPLKLHRWSQAIGPVQVRNSAHSLLTKVRLGSRIASAPRNRGVVLRVHDGAQGRRSQVSRDVAFGPTLSSSACCLVGCRRLESPSPNISTNGVEIVQRVPSKPLAPLRRW